MGVSASVRLRVEVERFDPWRRLLLPMVFRLLEGGVYLGCVSSSGVEDGGFVCLFFSWEGGSLRCVVPGGARMRETTPRLWNKVLQASLFFVVVCSGGGVGSVSFLVQETVVGEASCRLPRVTPQWSVRRVRRLQSQAGSVDITKDAILFSV